MKITILAVGKIKEKYWNAALEEYLKRLNRYAKTQVLEVEDEATPDKASPREEAQIKEREGSRLLAKIPPEAHCIALAIEGKSQDSPAMSRRMEELALSGKSHLCFIIGGSLGLSEGVMQRADEAWSFSKLTFPHQLMRVILLEQIYRGFRIARNEPYHK